MLALSISQAEYTYNIMDMKEGELENAKPCPMMCDTLMNEGLKGVSLVFENLLKNLTFSAGFCDCWLESLGGFTFNETCTSNGDSTVFDHKLHVQFKKPHAECSCPLPNNPSAAAKKINSADSPVGNCGKDHAGNKVLFEPVKCEGGDGQLGKNPPIQLEAKMNAPIVDFTLRTDTRKVEHVYPLSISLTFKEKDVITLKDGPGFEKAWECISGEANKANFYRKLIFNVFKSVFDCLDDKNEHSRSIVDTILYFTGNCNNFNVFG